MSREETCLYHKIIQCRSTRSKFYLSNSGHSASTLDLKGVDDTFVFGFEGPCLPSVRKPELRSLCICTYTCRPVSPDLSTLVNKIWIPPRVIRHFMTFLLMTRCITQCIQKTINHLQFN